MSAQDVKAPEREPDAWLWLGGDGKPLTCALERIPYNDQTYYRVALYRDPQPDAEREAALRRLFGYIDHLQRLSGDPRGELFRLAHEARAAHQEGETK